MLFSMHPRVTKAEASCII